jgi:hypothetical protein
MKPGPDSDTRRRDRGAGGHSAFRSLALVVVLASMPVRVAECQQAAAVEPVQGLRFETLGTGGESIPIQDPFRRAEWLVRGEGSVELHLVLPPALKNLDGRGEIPLQFAFGDVGVLFPGSQEPVFFHPHSPIPLTLPEDHSPVRVILGGRARSTGQELAGSYQAPILLLVSKAGAES